jgi:transposase
MAQAADRQPEDRTDGAFVALAMELSAKKWKLALHDGRRDRARIATIDAWDFDALVEQVARARRAMSLPADCVVASCYEAGREGFSVHRRLVQLGIVNVIIDAASVDVNRRARRAKTDRLDAEMLVMKLLAHRRGEKAFSVVRVPAVDDEGARHEQRELQDLKVERARHRMRIEAWLLTEGIAVRWSGSMLDSLAQMSTIDGRTLSPTLLKRIGDEAQRLALVSEQIARIESERKALIKAAARAVATGDVTRDVEGTTPAHVRLVGSLAKLKGVGATSAFRLVLECFGWRRFRNRRQVAGCFGLAPTPFASGKLDREQGIAKLGRGALRSLLIELSWLWLKYQPSSAIALWYSNRCADSGSRQRRVGIVAVARKLAIALWKFAEFGVVPEGALMKI